MARAEIAAPIDRPLGKAYLREFNGWATAIPPGTSDPTSFRVMENCYITREKAVAVRPALRSILPQDVFLDTDLGVSVVGSFESFFLTSGEKGFLFAVREVLDEREVVGFRVASYDEESGGYEVYALDDPAIGFQIPRGYEALVFSGQTRYVRYVQIDNKIIAMSNAGEPIRIFWVGETKRAKDAQGIEYPPYTNAGRLNIVNPTQTWIDGDQETVPPARTNAADTLISSDATKNIYNFGYFYTFNSDIGESAPSMVQVVKTQRRWSVWEANVSDDTKSPDQLAAVIPESVFTAAVAQGAISWNLYMLTWSDQDSVPVEGVLLKTVSLEPFLSYARQGWATHTPLLEGRDAVMALPNRDNRYNATEPPCAAQGIVAGDRLVLVNDPVSPGVIRWSSNLQGDYLNFSPVRGGGYKTLTSGNLYVPATVKLWQNPQSIDTLTILCAGVDGYSTSYYMNPASTVSGLTQTTLVMGFEETTATPGTIGAYGSEVLNNALYHPMHYELMKSTASNFNINHKSMTDDIQNKWLELRDKEWLISSQFDNKIFYVVNNPEGIPVPEHCNGNEIWVCDTELEGVWSRWLIPAVSLRKIEIRGKLYLAVVKPDGFYILDDRYVMDDVSNMGTTEQQPIPWYIETNTQGANRAHDAWARLQQLQVLFGNAYGSFRYGIQSYDMHGKTVEISKDFTDNRDPQLSTRPMPNDIEDYLLIRRDLKEWRFFAGSIPDTPSYGQICYIQYRYAPVSVNVGYEYGSIETFEYQRGLTTEGISTTFNGIPIPMIDQGRP